jgi:hypothetical protein
MNKTLSNVTLSEPSLAVTNIYLQFLGIVFLIQTFVIWFYHNALQNRKEKYESDIPFDVWLKDWALVWIALSIPVIFVTSVFRLEYILILECTLSPSKNDGALILEFINTVKPYIWTVYILAIVLYSCEVKNIDKKFGHFSSKYILTTLLVGLFLLLLLILLFTLIKSEELFWLIIFLIWLIWISLPYAKLLSIAKIRVVKLKQRKQKP